MKVLLANYLAGWKRYADFKGRSHRAEYWSFFIGNIVLGMLLAFFTGVFAGYLGLNLDSTERSVQGLTDFVGIIPSLAIGFRRLHDIGKSGWWMFGPLVIMFLWAGTVFLQVPPTVTFIETGITLVAVIALFVFYLQPSAPGPNKYGPNPLE